MTLIVLRRVSDSLQGGIDGQSIFSFQTVVPGQIYISRAIRRSSLEIFQRTTDCTIIIAQVAIGFSHLQEYRRGIRTPIQCAFECIQSRFVSTQELHGGSLSGVGCGVMGRTMSERVFKALESPLIVPSFNLSVSFRNQLFDFGMIRFTLPECRGIHA